MQLAMVAAGFSPGEADQVRRSMAAWRRRGGLESFEHRLIDGMRERGYSIDFARQIFQQILGFGEYGFPESHAASFALLAYVSAWLKCHEPAAFACALLNSQPMGFYAPDQLVQDARRHGVTVLPVDVTVSEWECSLAPGQASGSAQPALRLGLRMVKGLSMECGAGLMAARAQRSFSDVDDLALRGRIGKRDLKHLAHAGALAALAGHRRQALWQVAAIEPALPLAAPVIDDIQPELFPLSEGQNVVADYAAVGLTLARHPLALLRAHLDRRHLQSASHVRNLPHGRFARVAGLVITRQRPATSSGVTFLTLEDETGHVNVVVWRDLAERQRRELLGARLLAVHGTLERQGEVLHLIAGRMEDLTPLLGKLVTHSRDFH